MKLEEAKRIADIIEKQVPHKNVDLLCVIGSENTGTKHKKGLEAEDILHFWTLTEAKSGRREKVPCKTDDFTLTGNARKIAYAFEYQPQSTTICLIQDSLTDLADIMAVIPDPKPHSYRLINFSIGQEGNIFKTSDTH